MAACEDPNPSVSGRGIDALLNNVRELARFMGRALFALMKDCPNVHAETSNLAGADFLRWAARELGARRLLFGSFLPVNDPWVALGMILEADLSWEEKRLVAGDNLRRLLPEAPA